MVRKKTHEEFISEVKELVGNEYTVLGIYTGNKDDILIRHNNESCGYFENSIKPNHFLRGRRCRVCSYTNRHNNMRKKHDEFVREVFDLVGSEYTVLGKYVNGISKIEMKHNSCGHVWNPKACEFVNNGKRCPKCFGNNKKTTEQFKEDVYEVVGDEYVVIGEYTTVHNKIRMRHNSKFCNYYEWNVEANSFLNNNRRCPACCESEGARRVRRYLESIKIPFEKEYTFNDLRGIDGGLLRFDFAILKDGELRLLIEYDGEFHYRKVYEEHDLEKQKLHDSLKDEYCDRNNIELLRIYYTNINNIESILDSFFKKENVHD